jgi:hypothetical protein
MCRACLLLQSNLRRSLKACVADLSADWDHCDTNRRRVRVAVRVRITDLVDVLGHSCTNRRRAACLLFDAPNDHPSCRLHPRAN